MSNYNNDLNGLGEFPKQKNQLRQTIYRIIPYLPLIFVALLIGIACSWVYLRYSTPIYAVKARLIVNDDTQQKSSNLLEIMKLDTRNLSTETEKEMKILNSRDLLSKLVSKLQLNVQYSLKGLVKTGQYFKNMPFRLELENPDSIKKSFASEVEIINKDKIRFNGIIYPVDTLIKSELGLIKWHVFPELVSSDEKNKWFVNINSVRSTVGMMEGGLKIEPISKQSSILDITYVDVLADRGINILTNLIDLYGTTTVDYKSRMSANTLNFLDGRLKLVSEELNGVEKNLQDFKTTQGIIDLGTEGDLFLKQVKESDAKLAETNVQLDVLNKIEQYVTQRNSTKSQIPASLGTTDPILIGLLNQLYQAEFELEKTRQISGEKNPQIEVYEGAINKLKPSILSSVNNLKLALISSRQRLLQDNSRITGTLQKIPQKERMLLDISRQQGIKNAIYTFLLQKREESAITAAAILPNYRIIEKPEFAGQVSPINTKIYISGIFIALLLVALYIYIREFANNRLLFRSQIDSKLTTPIISELSFQPSESGGPVVVGLENRSLIGEQFRELRTNLNYVTALTKERSKIILVTSSISGEGKSFVSINTAVSLSLTGARVVLLEFDLRKPKISRELGVLREPGLSNYLINAATENEIIKPHSSITNFNIIPSGPIPPNPAELISGPRLTTLMDYLKLNFDYIIIDTPPVGAVTDAKILASFADCTLYIVRHNYTNISLLELINDVQIKNILPNLNIVFNGITVKTILGYNYAQTYNYSYGYGYGYGYGYTDEKVKSKKK